MAGRRPLPDVETLLSASDDICSRLSELEWQEAFRSHPRIGESRIPEEASQQSAEWSGHEQQMVTNASEPAKLALTEGNREYERKFGRIFIVCAAGKSPEEILTVLRCRLENDPTTEFREAAEQQRQITQLRLRKWLRT
jgi:2-oxo-4-hydroxy-4-carboxy-5-ureidoimidazoline decarboxylase